MSSTPAQIIHCDFRDNETQTSEHNSTVLHCTSTWHLRLEAVLFFSKRRELYTQGSSVISQKTGIFCYISLKVTTPTLCVRHKHFKVMPKTHSPGKIIKVLDLLSNNFARMIVSVWITWA
jgi:hypothetical protein